ncbi:MAG TPA: hypothetical protein VGQ83_31375 [Polyangia bacterium]|jgi:hypothetical protein
MPFDPDATIDESRAAPAKPFDPDRTVDERVAPTTRPDPPPAAPRAAAGAPPALASFSDDTGDETVLEPLPAAVKDALPSGKRRRGQRLARADAPGGDSTVEEKRPDYIAPCPHCRKLIDARNVLCPLCRKPTGKRAVPAGLVTVIGAAVIILVALYFVWQWLGTPTPPPPAP